jgi:hypothetical protein
VRCGLIRISKVARRFDNDFYAEITPWNLGRVALSEYLDLVSVHDQRFSSGFDFSREAPIRGIIFEEMSVRFGISYVVSTVSRCVEQTWTAAVRTALIQSSFPSAPATFQEVIGSGHVLERMWSGTSPLWTSS